MSPAFPTIHSGQTQQFTATVTGTSNQAVTWNISPQTGSISSTGLYTAPATISSEVIINISVTSAADPTKNSTSAILLAP